MLIRLLKVDAAQRLVYGSIDETPDHTSEVFDYASSAPFFKAWSDDMAKASGGKNLGNVRAMHGNIAAGLLKAIEFDDEAKRIDVCAHIVDDSEWAKVEAGVYTGFSPGGKYVKRWPAGDGLTRYTAQPSEISIVDKPCIPSATFTMVKADGAEVEQAFAKIEAQAEDNQAVDGETAAETVEKAEAPDRLDALLKQDGAADALADLLREGIAPETPREGIADLLETAMGLSKAAPEGELAADEPAAEDVAVEEPAQVEKADPLADLQKFLGEEVWDASRAMDALNTVTNLLSDELWEAERTGEEASDQIAALRDAIARIKTFIVSELQESNDPIADADGVTDLALADPTGDLAKAGARHGKTDKAHMESIHKALVGMGYDCGTAAKADDAEDMVKAAQAESLSKFDADVVHPIAKAMGLDESANIVDAVTKMVTERDTLAARVKELEDLPAPPKGFLKSVVVNKEDDGSLVDEARAIAADLEKMTPAERTLELMKMAQRAPIHLVKKPA